ncbi:MAG: Ig-like domain-containing protein, partial [Rhodoglobus sp.]|nr:Ig-like domain-containing protein [Rhodoglobus sp.]
AGSAVAGAPYTRTFTPTAAGTYTLDAIATDDRGNTGVSNAVTIVAAFANPTIAITTPSPATTARATPNVPLTVTASAQGGGGAAILLVELLVDGVSVAARTTPTAGTNYSFQWTPTTAQLGAHVITTRVTDTNSQSATSAPLNVNVATLVGVPPTVTIAVSPSANNLQTASTVNFTANAVANGTGNSLTGVEFFLNDVSIGTAAREQTTNVYRLAYNFGRFDFASITPTVNETTGAVTYPLRLYAIARDSNNNQTVSSTSNLVLNPATSTPPTLQLQALSPTTITAGTPFLIAPTFDDLDGVVVAIQLFANGSNAGAALTNPQLGQILTYNATTAGRFNLYAVATDDTGNTSVSSPAIVVTVTAISAPVTAITRPSDNSTVTTVGAPVFLEGTATIAGSTQVPTMQFIATGSGGGRTALPATRVGTTTTYRATWTPTVADTFTLSTQATVGTVSGTSPASRRVVVTNLQGLGPSVTLAVPNTATTGSTSNFTATASDSDGSVIEVEFFLNRNSIGLAQRDQQTNTWRLTASFAGVPLGATEVVALARDSSGNVAASPTSTVNVTAAASIGPSITISPSTTNAAFSRQVQLTANARDADGTVTSVQYFANATSLGTSTNAGTNYQVNWTPTQSGIFNLWALATDNSGITTVAATVPVTVRRNNPVLEDAAFILQTYQDIANT